MNKKIVLNIFLLLCGYSYANEVNTVTATNNTGCSNYIPVSFVDGNVAYDVNLSESSNTNVLFNILGNATLPNGYSSNKLSGCQVSGNVKADMSANRAVIKLDNITCVESGNKVKTKVEGFIADEDSKAGILLNKTQSKTAITSQRPIKIIFTNGFCLNHGY